MRIRSFCAAAFTALLLPCIAAAAASVTVAGLADSEDGLSLGVDARFSPTDYWSAGAGVGRQESKVGGTDFSGTSLRASTALNLDAVSVEASLQRWKDSNQLRSTTFRGQLGWMAANGLSLSALVDDRNLTVKYTTTVLGQPQDSSIDFNGRGFGADASWFGESWILGVRFIDYDYGHSVDRVRAAISSTSTRRFPRVGSLLDSIVTRASGAPDRLAEATVGRQFSRTSLQGDLGLQRDALTNDEVTSLSLTHGYRIGRNLRLDTTLGFSGSGASDTMVFGGLALTLRTQAAAD